MAVENVRNIIIGSGEGGKVLAWHLAAAGEQTVVIERKWVGGSCPNVNCLPAKNEIWSAKVAELNRHSKQFGVITGDVSIDMAAVRQRKRGMVDALVKIHLDKYRATGAELVMGHATFTGDRTIDVKLNNGGTRTLVGERVFLNLGTHAAIPEAPGMAEAKPLTHIEIMELDRVPAHLIVIGGGHVGLEFAQAFRRFGSQVTILQRGDQLLKGEDADIAAELTKVLVSEGISIVTSADIVSVRGQSGTGVSLTVRTPSGDRTIEGSDLLAAAGRIPNTSGMGLEVAGVTLDNRGYLKVNNRLETAAPSVWGIGECAGSPQFTHASLDDFRIIRDNLAGGHRSTSDRLMPSCLYTDPAVARIGLSENEAKRKGISVRVAKIPIAAVLRTRTIDETTGFMKALIDAENRIVGFSMIGSEAGEVMSVVQTAMLAKFQFTVLRDAVLAHPTMAEGLNVLFSTIKPV